MTPNENRPETEPVSAGEELTAEQLEQVAGGVALFQSGRNRNTASATVGGEQGRESTQLGLTGRGGQNRR